MSSQSPMSSRSPMCWRLTCPRNVAPQHPLARRPVAVLQAACTASALRDWYLTVLGNNRINAEVVTLNADTTPAVLRSRVLMLGCSRAPTALELEDWSDTLRDAVTGGSWVVLDGPAQQALVQWGRASLGTQNYFQVNGLEAYYLEPAPMRAQHPLLRDLPVYRVDPMAPPPPFQTGYLIGLQPPKTGMAVPFVSLAANPGITDLGTRFLQMTLYLGNADGSADARARCTEAPYLCNPKRALQVWGRDVPVFTVGQGFALGLENAPLLPGVWQWGPVSQRIHLNAVRWARGEIQ